jgi:hypothetical protein
VGKLTV